MSDATVITDEKYTQEDREKSFQQILQEQQQGSIQEDLSDEEKLEAQAKEEEEKKAQDEEAQTKLEAERKAEEERQADLASKAADEVLRKQEESKKQDGERVKAEAAEKERQEALKPKFSAVDEKGNPVPKTYQEIAEEGARIGEERAVARMKAEQEAEKERLAAEKAVETEKKQAEEKVLQEKRETLDRLVKQDLDDLYAADKLPKIVDKDDENDLGNREFRNLLETAQRVNTERMKNGKDPISSIKLIYYEHYKPLEELPGGDAPVLGNEANLSTDLPEDEYIPARDRNKSMTELLKEEAQRLAKRVGVRSR